MKTYRESAHSASLSVTAWPITIALSCGVLVLAGAAKGASRPTPAPLPETDIMTDMAGEVTDKLLTSSPYQERVAGGHRPRLVVGDITNNSDDESVRVDDLLSLIRDRIVASGTARLFEAGELKADLIISPELTSTNRPDLRGNRKHCFVLQLTLSTILGEYISANEARRCER